MTSSSGAGSHPGPDFPDLAILAEELGYARLWVYDSASDPDVAREMRALATAFPVAVPVGSR